MANNEQAGILRQGVVFWNKWREEHHDAKIDLSGLPLLGTNLQRIDLSNAYLCETEFTDADLSSADLRGADLTEADLIDTDLRGANLTAANLSEAKLWRANFRDAKLIEVNFNEAELKGANFSSANLTKSNFENAHLLRNYLVDIDLSEVEGLEEVVHGGPSTIGIDTIAKSKGKIPEVFLRGCGLSDADIEYTKLAMPGLDPEQVNNIIYKIHDLYLGKGIQYYSCFISYSSKDQEFAQCLHDDLQNNGVRCWFDREDIKIGDIIRPTIDRQIRLRDKLLVIISENSLQSEYVGDEVEAALEEELKGNRLVLFPIRLDDNVMNTRDDWSAKIRRRRHIGDFSNWKDKNSYQKALERLLRDLKATD